MTSEKALPRPRELRPDHELDRRYGAIGISAVAAAIRFQGSAREQSDQQAGHEQASQDSDRARKHRAA